MTRGRLLFAFPLFAKSILAAATVARLGGLAERTSEPNARRHSEGTPTPPEYATKTTNELVLLYRTATTVIQA